MTIISFELPAACEMKLAVYDILSREIQTLGAGHWSPGKHNVIWNAGNVCSGLYIMQLTAGNLPSTAQELLLIKR